MSATLLTPSYSRFKSRFSRFKSRFKDLEFLFAARQKKEREALKDKVNSARIDKLFKDFEVVNLYDKERYDFIKQKTLEKIALYGNNTNKIESLVRDLGEIFTERKIARQKFAAQTSKKADVIRAEQGSKDPKILPIDIATLHEQQKIITPVGSDIDILQHNKIRVEGGITGANKAGRKYVETPNILPGLPRPADKISRNIIWDLEEVEQDQVRANNGDLIMRLGNQDRKLSAEEKHKLTTYRPLKGGLSNAFEAFGVGATKVTHFLGRGIYSKTDASRTEEFEKFRNEIFEGIARQIYNANIGGENYATILKKVYDNAASKSITDILSYASQHQLSELTANQIKLEKEANDAKAKAFNESMTKELDNWLKEYQPLVDKDDDMWKYRVLRRFLIFCPFLMPLPIVGFLADYMDIFSKIINPIFGDDGLAKGIARLASQETLGPLGWVSENMYIPQTTEFLLENTPIVSQIVTVFDSIVQSAPGQALFGTLLPVIEESILTPIIIGFIAAIYDIDSELGLRKEKKNFLETKGKSLGVAMSNFGTSIENETKARKDKFAEEIINKKFSSENCKKVELAKFCTVCDEELLKFIISDANETTQKSLIDAKKDGKLGDNFSSVDTLKTVDEKELEKITKKFIAYLSIEKEITLQFGRSEKAIKLVKQNLEELEKLKITNSTTYDKKIADLQDEGTKIAVNNVIFEEGRRHKLANPHLDKNITDENARSAIASDLRVAMIKLEKNLIRSLPNIPNPDFVSPYSTKLAQERTLYKTQ